MNNPKQAAQVATAAKFVEQAPQAPALPPVELTNTTIPVVEANPFVPPVAPAPKPVVQEVTPLAAHQQLWLDAKALILFAKRLNIDFESLLRGALQEINKGF